MSELDLEYLKKTATDVSSKNWEVWDNTHGDPVVIEAGRTRFQSICDVNNGQPEYGRLITRHIAANDPATVIALIERLEQAEKNAEYFERKHLTIADLARAAHKWNSNKISELKAELSTANARIETLEKKDGITE